jgi:hypothetical protein
MQKSTDHSNSAQHKESLDSQPHRGFFAFIPAHVRDSRELSPYAKLLYAEISALTHERGYCWASNARFASILNVCTRSIKNWMRELRDHGFIEVQIDRHDFREQRKIWLSLENKEKFRVGTAVPTPHSSRENDSTNNRQGGNGGAHRWERACPLKNTYILEEEEERPVGFGFRSSRKESPEIIESQAQEAFEILTEYPEVSDVEANDIVARYTLEEIETQLKKIKLWSKRHGPVLQWTSTLRKFLLQAYGARNRCNVRRQ